MEDSNEELRAEAERLGPRARERIQAVEAYITAQTGDLAPGIIRDLTKAHHVEGFERLMANARAQRNAAAASKPAPSQQPPEPRREPSSEPGKVDEATWQKMTPAVRLDYVRQFPQPTTSG
jgi:hypothetical protein